MSRRTWTDAELAVLRAEYATTNTRTLAERLGRSEKSTYKAAHDLGLRKDPAYMSEVHGALARQVGAASRFRPGMAAWNKGTRYEPGGRSVETRFKPGALNGAARHNYRPIGSLRITKGGILERKITDDHPVPARRWVSVARLLWIAAHGPVPEGHVIAFRRGMHTTVEHEITLDRLECITRAEHARRNSVHRHGPEIARLTQLKGAITRQVNKRRRARQEQEA